jgi:ATP-dependent helicase/nuclease subunit B
MTAGGERKRDARGAEDVRRDARGAEDVRRDARGAEDVHRDARGGDDARRHTLVTSVAAADRIAAALRWLETLPRDREVLLLAASAQAADELLRAATRASGARFGIHRTTLPRFAALLARAPLAERGRVPVTTLSATAVAARATHALAQQGALGYLGRVADKPGFATALVRTLGELRGNDIAAQRLRGLGPAGDDLALLAGAADDELTALGLADRALIFRTATEVATGEDALPPVGAPLLLLDVPLGVRVEEELLAALVQRAEQVFATTPHGDDTSAARLTHVLGRPTDALSGASTTTSLACLQRHLFASSAPEPQVLDQTVTLRGWPGVARECVEIVRTIQAEAAAGVPFDRIAVLVHAPTDYVVQLDEAFTRAGIPACFAHGTTRPHAAGRALLALLACAAERLSARRFAEYLSLAQVPDPQAADERRFVPPRDELLQLDAAAEPDEPRPERDEDLTLRDPDAAARRAGTVRAPWRWEQLLVDAAVIGSAARWKRRLDGLRNELDEQRAGIEPGDEGRLAQNERRRHDLEHLAAFALPLIERLAALPERAAWRTWLDELRALVRAAVREPEPVLAVLAELEPIAPVGPVGLDEVRMVLAPRLRDLAIPPALRRYGAVYVAPAEAARGLTFDVVFVPGLAEKLFPRKIVEDPLLPDARRAELGDDRLETQATRTARERLALHLAVGAARERVHLSYPRVDVEQARARVPSFYLLEALRATEGVLPGFDALARRTASASTARLGWPAPDDPAAAIDDSEYDLALLAPLVDVDERAAQGAAHYLLGTNVHLARALRARGRRWKSGWFPSDGLVDPDEPGREALARHQLGARSFSATALQNYAACPYRFFLQALLRLTPREEPVAIEQMDALTRGGLFHDVQFAVLTTLRTNGLLPITADTLPRALTTADEKLSELAAQKREELAPAIPRVWDDSIAGMRADLHEWLRRAAEARERFVPERFELSFGLADRDRAFADPASVDQPVALPIGIALRGSIDLVEGAPDGVLRITDHKTGKARAGAGLVIGGGEILQPVLYALAAEQLLDAEVESGRLYYCTADGGYADAVVPLDDRARDAAVTVANTIGGALGEGFLPAAPKKDACRWCDYRPICGPHEELRTSRKNRDRLAPLTKLREQK